MIDRAPIPTPVPNPEPSVLTAAPVAAPVRSLAAAMALVLLAAGCAPEPAPPPEEAPMDLDAEATRLARELVIADTHIDVPYRLEEEWEDITEATEGGQFDYPRAIEGGLDVAFMSIYVPASFQETGGAREHAEKLIEMVEGFEAAAPEKYAVARTVADVRRLAGTGVVALPMGMENGAPLETLADVKHFYDRGIRYVTLTHSENNQICDSSYADERAWDGLSPFGREVVAEMNRLGIMVDVSHVSDAAFDQVLEVTRAPVIASHSSCRHFTPGFERNMSDEMIRALAANGGVIQINFGSAFLTETANRQSREFWAAYGQYVEESSLPSDADEHQAWRDAYRRDNPLTLATISDVVDHIDHVVGLVGVDHVGIGSDYDGVGPTTPIDLEDVSKFPNLVRELLERGYSEGDVAKILGENLLRVWTEVEQAATELPGGGA